MKGFKLVLFFIVLFSGNIFAQPSNLNIKTFEAFSEYLFNDFGIACKIPVKFTNLDKYNVSCKIRKNKDKHVGGFYGSTFISNDKECIIMYSAFPHHISIEDAKMRKKKAWPVYPRSQMNAEMQTALGLYKGLGYPLNNNSKSFDFNKYVTTVSGKKAREMFNADSIYIYEIPGGDSVYFSDESLEKMRKRKFPHCTSVFISKNDRASMDIRIFLTKKGKKKEDEYIDMLSKQVWFYEDFKSK